MLPEKTSYDATHGRLQLRVSEYDSTALHYLRQFPFLEKALAAGTLCQSKQRRVGILLDCVEKILHCNVICLIGGRYR